MSPLEQELGALLGRRLSVARPLCEFTSFQIGGPADLLAEVESDQELAAVLQAASGWGVVVFCLGAGTNLLVSDNGVRGVVVTLSGDFRKVEVRPSSVIAGAAAQFGSVVETAVEHGLAGLEFGEGIPGTVGGGLVMNAGAFGGEIARVVRSVHCLADKGEMRQLDSNQMGFRYRRSSLPPGWIITRVDFELADGDRDQMRARIGSLRAKRASRQPNGLPNAGSVFKNPPGDFAGRILEEAGLKGESIGGAAFSSRHANFIVNLGGARAAEVRALIEMAQRRVRERTGVCLEPEVRMVGEW